MSVTRCSKQTGKSQQEPPPLDSTDIKSSLRHMGRKNYLEQDDEDASSDYCPAKKKPRASTALVSERKLSLRSRRNSTPCKIESSRKITIDLTSPKRNQKRDISSLEKSDRKLRNQNSNDPRCCGGQTDSNEIKSEPNVSNCGKTKRKSKSCRLTSSNINRDNNLTEVKAISPKRTKHQSSAMPMNGRTSLKAKPELSKLKVIDHFSQSEEINIESSASNLPKKSSSEVNTRNINASAETITAKKRHTLLQKHTENNQQKLNGGSAYVSNHTSRISLSHHGKLCRKTKKTMIYHDSNGWILSKGYWSAPCDFWDWSHFDKSSSDKSVKTQQEIEIPSFREKKYTPLYKIEGTEDLSDHVFEKRHLQYEIMEKKIKKNFVMQSKYELQKSKYLKNNELLYKKESFLVKKFPKFVDLTPDCSNVKKIEIVTDVPVMALGVPVKRMEAEEFNLTPAVAE